MLEDVKKRLGITGVYQDELLQGYIDEVKAFLIDSGVDAKVLDTSEAIGIIARGVSDLWDYGNGGTNLSPYFYQRAIQLASKTGDEYD